MNNPTKLVQAAEYIAENHEENWESYYEDMAEELRRYPVDEKDQFYYREIESMFGFKTVLDVVFGEDPTINHDGMEGLEEAAKEHHIRFIEDREEKGFHPKFSFRKSLPIAEYPEWFRKEMAEAELERIPDNPLDEETEEYKSFLLEVLEQEDIKKWC